MDTGSDDGLEQMRLATAALLASLVQTIAEKDHTFADRFDKRVKDWYGKMRESGNMDALALLSWTREAVRSRGPAHPPQTKPGRKRVTRYSAR
jgi:hypothetical protein